MNDYEAALEAWEAAQENEALRANDLRVAQEAHRISQDARRAAWVALMDAERAVQRERASNNYTDTHQHLLREVQLAARMKRSHD